MEVGNKDSPPSNKETLFLQKEKEKLIQIDLSLMTWYGAWASPNQKQFLPDSPIIPLVTYKDGRNYGIEVGASDLIATGKLRGDAIFTSGKEESPDQKFKELIDSDQVNIPSDFVKEGTFIILLIPRIDKEYLEDRIKNYDITALKCVSSQKLLKLTSSAEYGYGKDYNWLVDEGILNKQKLPIPKKDAKAFQSPDFYPDLVTIENKSEDLNAAINIWTGNVETDENIRKRIINGTICYRMIEGKAEKKKSEETRRIPILVPQQVNI